MDVLAVLGTDSKRCISGRPEQDEYSGRDGAANVLRFMVLPASFQRLESSILQRSGIRLGSGSSAGSLFLFAGVARDCAWAMQVICVYTQRFCCFGDVSEDWSSAPKIICFLRLRMACDDDAWRARFLRFGRFRRFPANLGQDSVGGANDGAPRARFPSSRMLPGQSWLREAGHGAHPEIPARCDCNSFA
jgi:hypothetical protein